MIQSWEDAIALYDEALDMGDSVEVGGLTFAPSRVLREVDPVAYRCGLLDYVDSLERDGEATDSDEWEDAWRLP